SRRIIEHQGVILKLVCEETREFEISRRARVLRGIENQRYLSSESVRADEDVVSEMDDFFGVWDKNELFRRLAERRRDTFAHFRPFVRAVKQDFKHALFRHLVSYLAESVSGESVPTTRVPQRRSCRLKPSSRRIMNSASSSSQTGSAWK